MLQPLYEVADITVGIERLVAADECQFLCGKLQVILQGREEEWHALLDATLAGCFKGRFELFLEPAILETAEDLR